jgi:endonuclease/exonuclease/phosphatase family metal-dependent hydrolase
MNPLIRLLSLNVSLFDENNEKLTHFISDVTPDIVCLQEVTRKVDDSALDSFISKGAIDQAVKRLPYSFYVSNWALRDFKLHNFHGKELFQFDFNGVIEYGNYIKSRFKITEGKGIFVQDHFSYITNWEWMANNPGKDPRVLQVADIQINNEKKLRILNYHGIWSKDKRDTDLTISASQKIVQCAHEVACPVIICGDFNLFPDTKSIGILKDNFNSLVDDFHIMYTRPKSNELSSVKRNVVDYVFVSKEISVKQFNVIDNDVSDHLPLLMEFNINN